MSKPLYYIDDHNGTCYYLSMFGKIWIKIQLRKTLLVIGGVVVCFVSLLLLQKKYYFLKNPFTSTQSVACKDCNVLLISLDTCGADHMSTYGYERDTTPNFTELAKQGVLFQHAYANANWTLPSHVSIFTGLYPLHHKIIKPNAGVLDSSIVSLPEILQINSYHTYFYAPSDAMVFPEDTVYIKGIDNWEKIEIQYHVVNVDHMNAVFEELERAERERVKKFIFLHTYACHSPFIPEDEPLLYANISDAFIPLKTVDIMNAPFSKEYLEFLLVELERGLEDGSIDVAPEKIRYLLNQLKEAETLEEAKNTYDEASRQGMYGNDALLPLYKWQFEYEKKIDEGNSKHVEYLKAIYDQGIHTMDNKLIGLLRQKIANTHILKNTIIIITADHGEEFMEHGKRGHTTVYNNNTHVPLLILGPNITPSIVSEYVQSVDIFPTILALIGIYNDYKFDGISLLPAIQSKPLEKRLILGESNWSTHPYTLTVRSDEWKLFLFRDKDALLRPYALYNTKNDPEEKFNIMSGEMGKVKSLMKELNVMHYSNYTAAN